MLNSQMDEVRKQLKIKYNFNGVLIYTSGYAIALGLVHFHGIHQARNDNWEKP